MNSYWRIAFILLYLWCANYATAQKGTWQIALEKQQDNAQIGQEAYLVLACAIAQEVKEYNLALAYKMATQALKEAQMKRLMHAEAEAHYVIAEILRLRGKPFEALAYHQTSIELFEKIGVQTFIQRAKRDRAFTYSSLSKFDSAKRVLESVLDWYQQHEPNTREHAITLYNIGINTLRLGHYQDALDYTRKAEKIFRKIPDSHNQIRVKNNIGLIQKNIGHYTEALQAYIAALKGYEKAGENQRATVIVLSNLGNVYASLNDSAYNKQIHRYYERAYKIAVHIQDTIQIISCIELLAKAEAMQKNFAVAKAYYEKGYKLIKQTHNYLEEGYYMMRISDIYSMAGEVDTAIKITEQALHIFETRNALEAIAQTQGKLALFYRRKNAYQISQNYALAAQENARKSDYNSIPYLHTILINNAIDMKNFQEAEQLAQNAITHFQRVKGASSLLEIYKLFIKLDTIQNKDASAVKWYARYNKLYDSLATAGKHKTILELQFKYDLQDQQRENEYLKKLNHLHHLETQEQGVIIIAVSSTLLIVLIVLFLLYKNRKKLTKLLILVSEKKHEIEIQNESLGKLNLTKDRILSIISHDMRSPLANLKAVLDLANIGYISLEEQVHMTQKLNKDIARVYDFLQNLLLWAESQMAGFVPSIVEVNLHTHIENVFDITENQASRKQIKCLNLTENPLQLQTDKDILGIVLLNLVSNAIKFTPESGEIKIAVTQKPHATIISVKDNGVGIPTEYQSKIFGNTRFTTNGTAEEKGTGFGLTLCLDFMKTLGGNLYFESTAGEGTTFFMEVPKLPTFQV